MRIQTLRVAILGVLILGLSGQELGAQEIRRAIPVNPAPSASPADTDLARFLAGLPVAPASPLARLQSSAAYQQHVLEMGKLWTRFNGNYYEPMQLWSAAELSPKISPSAPLFYFFSGPDAIHAMALYPEAPVYLLGGLESVGTIAPPTDLDPVTLEHALASLRKSVEVVLSYGHFITKDMKEDLERSAFRGVLPLLLSFVALSGGEILSTSYIGIDSGGVLKTHGNSYAGGPRELPGLRVDFRRSPYHAPQTLYYVQANVADGPLAANPAILQWTATFGRGNTYLKAASYLMHESSFSKIRKFLLTTSDSVLQDDSGIPLKNFLNGQWRLSFFGTYSGTLDIFKTYHQTEMTDAFVGASRLPFGTGYKWRPGESNLTLAIRAEPPKAMPVTP
jgi:hypothetical protein